MGTRLSTKSLTSSRDRSGDVVGDIMQENSLPIICMTIMIIMTFTAFGSMGYRMFVEFKRLLKTSVFWKYSRLLLVTILLEFQEQFWTILDEHRPSMIFDVLLALLSMITLEFPYGA